MVFIFLPSLLPSIRMVISVSYLDSGRLTTGQRFLSVAVITCASHAQGRRFDPGRKHPPFNQLPYPFHRLGSYRVTDFESSDPSSNLGRTCHR